MLNIILQMISIIIQTVMFSYFLFLIKIFYTDEKCTKKQLIALVISCFFMVTCGMILNKILNVLNTLLLCIVIFLISKFILKLNVLKSLSIPVFTFIFLGLTELISFSILMIIIQKSSEYIASSTFLLFIVVCLQVIISSIIIKILIKYKDRLKGIKANLNKMTPKQIKTFLLIMCICFIPQILIFVATTYNYPPLFLLVNSIQLMAVCIITISYFNSTVGRDLVVSELTITKLHNRTMTGMIDGVRTIKHDYNNIIQALNGYMSTKQYDKLQEHINGVLGECNIINTLSTIDPKVFNDPAIYGIVGAKFFIANEKDIPFELDITTNIAEIDFPKPDLSRILGIIIDNAIEATEKVNNKYVKIEMSYDKHKCADVIKVYNTFDTKANIDLSKIYDKGVSSKKVKSGIGLWEVKKLINKNPNSQVFATIEKDKFIQNIIIEKTV